MVQWLRLRVSTAAGKGSILSQGTKTHMLCSAAKKKKASSWYRDQQLESLAKWDLNTAELTSVLQAA